MKPFPPSLDGPGTRQTPRRAFPVITVGLVGAGILIFGLFPDAVFRGAAWLSVNDLGWLNLVLVTAAGVLVHPDPAHLFVCLILLSFFGVLLERRLGPWRVVVAVLMGSVLAGLIQLNLLLDQRAAAADAVIHLVPLPPMGFSGAVAGLMGLFVMTGAGRAQPASPGVGWGRWIWPPAAAIAVAVVGLFLMRHVGGGPAPAAALARTVAGWAWLSAFLGGLVVGVVVLALDAEADAAPSKGMTPERQNPKREAGRLCRYRMA